MCPTPPPRAGAGQDLPAGLLRARLLRGADADAAALHLLAVQLLHCPLRVLRLLRPVEIDGAGAEAILPAL